jgi:hypothetical protein
MGEGLRTSSNIFLSVRQSAGDNDDCSASCGVVSLPCVSRAASRVGGCSGIGDTVDGLPEMGTVGLGRVEDVFSIVQRLWKVDVERDVIEWDHELL